MKNDTIQFAVKVFPRILFSRMALAIAALIAIAGCASSQAQQAPQLQDRKSTRLNSSHRH